MMCLTHFLVKRCFEDGLYLIQTCSKHVKTSQKVSKIKGFRQSYLLASSTATATVIPTMGVLPLIMKVESMQKLLFLILLY